MNIFSRYIITLFLISHSAIAMQAPTYQTPREALDSAQQQLIKTIEETPCYPTGAKSEMVSLVNMFVRTNLNNNDTRNPSLKKTELLIKELIVLQQTLEKIISLQKELPLTNEDKAVLLNHIAQTIRTQAKEQKEQTKGDGLDTTRIIPGTLTPGDLCSLLIKESLFWPKKALFYSLRQIVRAMIYFPSTRELLVNTANETIVGLEIQEPGTVGTLALKSMDGLTKIFSIALEKMISPSPQEATSQPTRLAEQEASSSGETQKLHRDTNPGKSLVRSAKRLLNA